MRARKASERDWLAVVNNIAPRCTDELIAAGSSLHAIKKIMRPLQKRGDMYALLHNDRTVAIIAWAQDIAENGLPYVGTYFLATDVFFSREVPSVLFGRHFMRQLQKEVGNKPIVSSCYGVHPEI